MNTKGTFALLIVAVGLVAAALFYGRHEEMVISDSAAPIKKVAGDLTSATIEKIEISAPGEQPVTLEKKTDVWYSDAAKSHRADKAAMSGIFSALEKDIEGEVVSTNPESYEDYLVSDTSGTRVKIYQGGKSDPAADLIIGKDGAAAFTTFVREADSKEVVNARATLSFTFKKPDGWRDKSIMEFPQDSVVRVNGEGTSGTFELVKEGSAWKLRKPDLGDAQPAKVNPMISMASSLKATGFVDKSSTQSLAEFGLDPPRQKFVITHEDKSTSPPKPITSVLLLGSKKGDEAQVYAKLADSDDVYTIGEYMNTTFSPDPTTLALNPPAPPPAPAETTATVTAVDETLTTGTNDAGTTEPTTAASTQGTEVKAPVETPAAVSATPVAATTPTPAPTPMPTQTPEPVAATPAATTVVATTPALVQDASTSVPATAATDSQTTPD